MAIGARFQNGPATVGPRDLCQIALAAYAKSSANSFTDSLAMTYLAEATAVTIIKPLEYFRWTIDSAFSDGRQIMSAFSTGRT